MKIVLCTTVAFLFTMSCYAQEKQANRDKEDSCVGCIFLGLNREEWKIKDLPYWTAIDARVQAKYHGVYLGDLPSTTAGFFWAGTDYYEVHIYHPSVDSMQIERHYLIRRVRSIGSISVNNND